MTGIGPEAAQEIERLLKLNRGLLKAEDVVEAAQNETSPLHRYFDWDDTEAAKKWRIRQAREIIRVHVTMIEGDEPSEFRALVSLSTDRLRGGGYRALVSVLKNKGMRQQLLADALDDMQHFKAKYAALRELATVFAAMDSTIEKIKTPV